jgi:hypothetical protein
LFLPAASEINGGSIADLFFQKRLYSSNLRPKDGLSAAVRNHARQREENE